MARGDDEVTVTEDDEDDKTSEMESSMESSENFVSTPEFSKTRTQGVENESTMSNCVEEASSYGAAFQFQSCKKRTLRSAGRYRTLFGLARSCVIYNLLSFSNLFYEK